MNQELKIIREQIESNVVTKIDLGIPSNEVIVKNLSDGDIYVYIGERVDNFDENKAALIPSKMGQYIFENVIYKKEYSFDCVYIKSISGGEVELQIVGF